MADKISQDAFIVDLEWVANDPVSLSWIHPDAGDLQGEYVGEIRQVAGSTRRLAALTVVTTRMKLNPAVQFDRADPSTDFEPDVAGPHLLVEVSLLNSTKVPPTPPEHVYDIQQVGGPTRWRGRVHVVGDVYR